MKILIVCFKDYAATWYYAAQFINKHTSSTCDVYCFEKTSYGHPNPPLMKPNIDSNDYDVIQFNESPMEDAQPGFNDLMKKDNVIFSYQGTLLREIQTEAINHNLKKYDKPCIVATPDLLTSLDHRIRSAWYPQTVPLDPPFAPCERTRDLILVSHCPSVPQVKGTKYFQAAMMGVERAIPLIVFKEPYLSVIEKKRRSHIHFDNLRHNVPGMNTMESLAMGIPTLCGTQNAIRESWNAFGVEHGWGETPLIETTIETLREDLQRMVDMGHDILKEYGSVCRTYMEKVFSPENAAKKLVETYEQFTE